MPPAFRLHSLAFLFALSCVLSPAQTQHYVAKPRPPRTSPQLAAATPIPGKSKIAGPTSLGPTLAGCPLFPADNVWNTPIDNLPVDARSSAYIDAVGKYRPLHPDFGLRYGIPYVVVSGTTPPAVIGFEYDDQSDKVNYPIPADAPIEGGYDSPGDRHILVLDKNHCKLYELWRATPLDYGWEAGAGASWDLRSNALRPAGWTSADAAGLPILPLLVRYDEVASGEVRHALRFTVPQSQRAYVWPARHFAAMLTDPEYMPLGTRLRLRKDFDIAHFSPRNQVILRALKKYGMILADNGGALYLSGVPDRRWNDLDLDRLKTVIGRDFEVVDESGLQVSPDSAQARSPSAR